VDTNTISEGTFLLTELRYTLGQLHVQLGDMDSRALRETQYNGRSVEQLLRDMIESERRAQAQYAQMLGTTIPNPSDTATQVVPLPVNESEEEPGPQATFEHLRAQTIDLLAAAGDSWSPELLAAVKQQAAGDRVATTALAECRKQFFEHDQRPDLDQPLPVEMQGTEPVPHSMSDKV
jgi:hypothetical protein